MNLRQRIPSQPSSVVISPYEMAASRELDAYLHHMVLKCALSHDYPRYSSDENAASALKNSFSRTHILYRARSCSAGVGSASLLLDISWRTDLRGFVDSFGGK